MKGVPKPFGDMTTMKLPKALAHYRILIVGAKGKCIPEIKCKGFFCRAMPKAFRPSSFKSTEKLRIMSSGVTETVKREMPGAWGTLDVISFYP